MRKALILLLSLLSIVAGLFYGYLHSVTVENAVVTFKNKKQKNISLPYEGYGHRKNEPFVFTFEVLSRMAQTKTFHITADDEITVLEVNGKAIDFEPILTRYQQKKLKDYFHGYDFVLPLQEGVNLVRVETVNYSKGGYTLKVGTKPTFLDFGIVFLLVIVPLINLVVNLLPRAVGSLCSVRMYRRRKRFVRRLKRRISTLPPTLLPWGILVVGVLLRLLYVAVYGHGSYQHDQHYHIEFIRYFSEHWALPLPDKALEFPQQPLYYFLTGKLMALLSAAGMEEAMILDGIALLSLLMMCATLVIAYRILRQLTEERFIINTALAFLAFTPSFIFLSGQINNDPLNYFLAASAIYFIVRYDGSRRFSHFAFALLFSLLVFLTKVSSGMISIILFMVLVRKYFVADATPLDKTRVLLNLKIYAALILVFLGFSFLRVYLPSAGQEFLFVNSGVFKGQEIHHLDLSYFVSFNIFSLINEGQAYVYDTVFMPVKQSFFTWQYATMLLGEYDYKRVFQTLALNRLVYVFGLICVAGIVAFVVYFRRMPVLLKFFGVVIVINQLLIANFAFGFPSVCNTDFRYNSPTILLWGLIAAYGLQWLRLRFPTWQKRIAVAVTLAAVSQIAWSVQLLIVAKSNTVS